MKRLPLRVERLIRKYALNIYDVLRSRVWSYHHILQLLLLVSIVSQGLVLSGCSSSSEYGRSVFVASFKYINSSHSPSQTAVWQNVSSLISSTTATSHLEVRASYFGVCATDGSSWVCARSRTGLDGAIAIENADPLGLTGLASVFSTEVLFPGLAIGSMALSIIVVLGLCSFPGWHSGYDSDMDSEAEVMVFPSRVLSTACLTVTLLNCIFAMLAAMWQHTSAATAATLAEASGYGRVQASVGGLAAGLTWMSFGILALTALGLILMILSIVMLDKLLDSDSEV